MSVAGNARTQSAPQRLPERDPAPLYHSALDMVGNTPMLELRKLDSGPCRLFVKMENLNPAQSIKDRIGIAMVDAAENSGAIDPKSKIRPTLVEATAGNTGLALALVAGQRGYNLIVVVPDKMSPEKIQHLRAMGAQVRMTRSDVTREHPDYFRNVAEKLASEIPNSTFINQFANEANWQAHYNTTGPEIWTQLEGKVDAIVVGVGSGGTLTGCARYLRERNPDLKVILADPAGSILAPLANEGKHVEPGAWLIEGMGEDYVPEICDLSFVDEAITVPDRDSFFAARELLMKEGILAGSSAGCLLHAAMDWARRQSKTLNVVTFICDSGAKYLSKMFNDYWMIDQGFIQRERTGDLRDLIARRHSQREDYTLSPDTPLRQAVRTMRLYDVSQIAVLEHNSRGHDRVVGIIDESDALLALSHHPDALEAPISQFMTTRLETIRPTAKVEELLPIFRADRVAIVSDEDGAYHGLITKIDMINYLRARLPA